MNKKILVVGPAWIGDMIMAQTLFILLKQIETCDIDVIAPNWTKPLLDRMPEVKHSLSLPIGHRELKLALRYQTGKALRNYAYDQAIVLPNSIKAALVPFFAKIPKRTGWLGEYRFGLLNDVRKLDKQKYPLLIERFMALAFDKKVDAKQILQHYQTIKPKLTVSAENVNSVINKFALTPYAKPILALCPGAEFGPAKQWPAQHYAHVANTKLAEGWQVWLFGSANDQTISTLINEATQNQCINLTGKTNLAEAIDLLSLVNMVVSNDSGLMHISAALNRKLVVVYGSSSPKFTPPLANQTAILQLDLPCSPCFQRTCKYGHLDCLNQLEPTQVLQSIDALSALKPEPQNVKQSITVNDAAQHQIIEIITS